MKCGICGKEMINRNFKNANVCSDECFIESLWIDRLELIEKYKNTNKEHDFVVVKGNLFFIENEKSDIIGYYGREFIILFHDDTYIKTKNLWYSGKIPDEFLERLPDNAIFLNEAID